MEAVDFKGRELKVGDKIAYCTKLGDSLYLKMGVIVKISDKYESGDLKLTVQPEQGNRKLILDAGYVPKGLVKVKKYFDKVVKLD